MTLRLSRTLPDRPVPPDPHDVWHALNYQIVPILKELIRALTASTATFSWTDNGASLDVGSGSSFASEVLTGDSTLVLDGAVDGMTGTIVVAQDGVGGHGLTFVSPDRTLLIQDPLTDTDPNPDPDSLTSYRYHFVTVASAAYVIIERTHLV